MYGFFLSRKSVQTKVTPRVSKTGGEEGGGSRPLLEEKEEKEEEVW